ncbi:hypothetical protein QQF64_004479 [Cirrhinus molitorella]|uniref:ribonuclease H n=1 Tax=Cirrhinus molitorella TaxID=172907 RepID=A0ABR3MGB1_9TELE
MPQGVTGAPATFQRLMEKAVGDMHLLQVIVYLDDLIVFGRTLEEHEERLFKVLDRLEEFGLKVSIDKCQFCREKVKYVGHIVSAAGIAPDPGKVEAVACWKMPTDLKFLRSFLGFCGFYRHFIKNYATIVKPLTDLTKGYPPVNGKRPLLYQTDNNPLTSILTSAKLNATGHRWLAALATYDFSIQYKPGKLNVDADILSRYPYSRELEEWTEIPHPAVKVVCYPPSLSQTDDSPVQWIDQLCVSPQSIPTMYACPAQLETGQMEWLTKAELKSA